MPNVELCDLRYRCKGVYVAIREAVARGDDHTEAVSVGGSRGNSFNLGRCLFGSYPPAGAALHELLQSMQRGRGATTAYLGVFSGNAPALRLYERLGFARAA